MSFYSIYRQGFVRVAACTPKCEVGDSGYNLAETLALARDGARQGVALMVFPELGLSAYAIDDLLGQAALLQRVEQAIEELAAASCDLSPIVLVGAPLEREGRRYNCVVAIHRGRILGVVPKGHLPNYREFYEKRWFTSGRDLKSATIEIAGQSVPFGMDLIFAAEDLAGSIFHIELCEDVWSPVPPSDFAALASAPILANLSAINIIIGKAETRRLLCATQSARCWAAHMYSAAGPGESTTDLAWDDQACIYELGSLLTKTDQFPQDSQMAIADVDVDRLSTGTFKEAAIAQDMPADRLRRIVFGFEPAMANHGLRKAVARFPYAPADPARLDQDCNEAYSIQMQGLMKRLRATGIRRLCIGVSGSLCSTQAFIVAAKAFDQFGWPRSDMLGFTMPSFATVEVTKTNACALMHSLRVTGEAIDIKPLAQQMLATLQHPFSRGEPVYDVTFENVQAGLHTNILFRAANQRGAMVLGTGDLSEIAPGWPTYGVGDQMSHYNVNASVPKTLIQHLIRWVARSNAFDDKTTHTLLSTLDTVISPELVPPGADGALQSAGEKIGPYELQDFTPFYLTCYGLKPSKIAVPAFHAWHDAWPPQYPNERRRAYDLPSIKSWMEVFLFRFFTISQFKRSATPNGPKVPPAVHCRRAETGGRHRMATPGSGWRNCEPTRHRTEPAAAQGR
ncbi:unnamed protein product [Phaeothamnion confervicola]